MEISSTLFERVIQEVCRQRELRETRHLFFIVTPLLLVSLSAIPFSAMVLFRQWHDAGASYFISIIVGNLNLAMAQWQDFSSSLIESLPLGALALCAINIAGTLFLLRVFLYRKDSLLRVKKNYAKAI